MRIRARRVFNISSPFAPFPFWKGWRVGLGSAGKLSSFLWLMNTIDLDVADADIAVDTAIGDIHPHILCFDWRDGYVGHG